MTLLCRVVCDSCADLGYCAAFLDAHYSLDNHLIAAAPGLLLACQNMLRDLREQRDTKLCGRSRDQQIAELRTAILKATGGQS